MDSCKFVECRDAHLSVRPLHFLGHIQARMQDNLVQVSHLVGELGLAIAALFGGAEFVFEEGVVLGAYDGKVVAHDSIYSTFTVCLCCVEVDSVEVRFEVNVSVATCGSDGGGGSLCWPTGVAMIRSTQESFFQTKVSKPTLNYINQINSQPQHHVWPLSNHKPPLRRLTMENPLATVEIPKETPSPAPEGRR